MKTYGIFNSHSIQALKYTTVLKVLSGDNKSSSCQRNKTHGVWPDVIFYPQGCHLLTCQFSKFLKVDFWEESMDRRLPQGFYGTQTPCRELGQCPLTASICPDHIYIVIYLYKLNQSCQYWSLFKTQQTGLLLQFVGLCQFLQSMISPTLWDFLFSVELEDTYFMFNHT